MTEETQVTMSELLKHPRRVFDRLQHERRLVITQHGRAVGTLQAPDPDETQLDSWADMGEATTDWRERQQGLRDWLRHAPGCTTEAGPDIGSEAVLNDRAETER
ncbi:hypothetical protein [Actinopolyspora halophila]|uniref:hypothetical protein n=1 Tax=Actinopolyspora halophila TaxID=1850 RepID=UPI0003A8B63E|nr:hypothetical protein [Actinopolyspora halophila]